MIRNVRNLILFACAFFCIMIFGMQDNAYAVEHYDLTRNGGSWTGYYYFLDGKVMKNCFFTDGTNTYYLMHNGMPMKDRLTYHPDGQHVIYFDKNGHELFNEFTHVTTNISGQRVDDYCYFDVHGYMYVDKLTYDRSGTNLYYINPYGRMERYGLFTFSDGARGFAKNTGDLVRDTFYTVNGNMYYFHGTGHCAQGLITDGCWYYNYDINGKYLGKFVKQNTVIFLDPGHDSTHTGASAGGLREEILNLKIATYCKAELEKYNGVTVYLARNEACPYPGTTAIEDIQCRINAANSVGAKAYISLHINSGGGGENGAEVYYQNSSWKPGIATTSQILANNIQNNLVSAGIGNRGIKIRDSTPDAADRYYPDGSLSDYYAVNHRGKTAGLPAIIVEHCFISSAYDRNNFLSNENSLMRMGVADARGIAETFGLSR